MERGCPALSPESFFPSLEGASFLPPPLREGRGEGAPLTQTLSPNGGEGKGEILSPESFSPSLEGGARGGCPPHLASPPTGGRGIKGEGGEGWKRVPRPQPRVVLSLP